ncbi:uncharacterized protein [Littorina saxatilis]|uniref:Death domain-containing protein n=1 Tax=Littorina saxatilis TaxID=31220 RepID=A0AAN9GK05_9CAEN
MNLIPEPEAQFRREVSTTHEAGAAGVTPPCSPSHVMSMTASPPYPLTTPLANTRGIVPLLKPLCGQGNNWRDLAEAVGLIYGDQMDIKKRSKDNNIHHLLVDCLIHQYGDNATIQVLLDALQKTGTQGRGVVKQMVNNGLNRPLDENRNAAGAEGGGLLVSSVEDRTPNTRAPKTPTTKSGLAKNTGLAGNDTINININFNVNQPKNVQFGDHSKAVFQKLQPNGMGGNTNNKEPPPKTPNEMKGSVIIKAMMAMIEAFLSLE